MGGKSVFSFSMFTFQWDYCSSPTYFLKAACGLCSSAKQSAARKGNFCLKKNNKTHWNLTLQTDFHCSSTVITLSPLQSVRNVLWMEKKPPESLWKGKHMPVFSACEENTVEHNLQLK